MDVYILIIIVVQDTLPFLIVVKVMLRLKECKGRENVEGGGTLSPKEVRELVPRCKVRFAHYCDHQSFSVFWAGLEICPRDHECFFYGMVKVGCGFGLLFSSRLSLPGVFSPLVIPGNDV